jgi:hypothetical protein
VHFPASGCLAEKTVQITRRILLLEFSIPRARHVHVATSLSRLAEARDQLAFD